MIKVDTYPFLAISHLTCHLEDTGMFFLVALCRLIVSGDKNTMVVFMPCHAWKWVPTAISSGAIIPKVPGCHLLLQMTSL